MNSENPLDLQTWVWTKADLLALKLIEEVHKRNMYIIFDGVFNHLGVKNFAFQDVEKNQQASPYKDWFMSDQLARQLPKEQALNIKVGLV